MVIDRRSFCRLLGTAAFMAAVSGRAMAQGTVRDMLGREVALTQAPRRIVLLDARDILSMALLHPDPASLVVGWASVDMFDSDLLRRQYEVRGDGQPIAIVGSRTADTVSAEKIIALEPDLVVATAFMVPDLAKSDLVRRLESAGVPVVFSNVTSNIPSDVAYDPFADLGTTMALWGGILGNATKAQDFTGFVLGRRDRLKARLAGTMPVKTYLEIQSTSDDCCWVAGNRLWGDLLTLAGGKTLSAVTAPWYAKLGVEQLLIEEPAVYIASGGDFAASGRPAIGPGLSVDKTQDGFRQLVSRTGFEGVPAVQGRRVHGVWTGLIAVPFLNILFVEAAARWLHPGLTQDIDPAATLDEINRRFLAKPIPGPCWATYSF